MTTPIFRALALAIALYAGTAAILVATAPSAQSPAPIAMPIAAPIAAPEAVVAIQ